MHGDNTCTYILRYKQCGEADAHDHSGKSKRQGSYLVSRTCGQEFNMQSVYNNMYVALLLGKSIKTHLYCEAQADCLRRLVDNIPNHNQVCAQKHTLCLSLNVCVCECKHAYV